MKNKQIELEKEELNSIVCAMSAELGKLNPDLTHPSVCVRVGPNMGVTVEVRWGNDSSSSSWAPWITKSFYWEQDMWQHKETLHSMIRTVIEKAVETRG